MLTMDPDVATGHLHSSYRNQQKLNEQLLDQYFDRPEFPKQAARKRMARLRAWAWQTFDAWIRTGPKSGKEPGLAPYNAFRSRATQLNYFYSSQYRGAFVLNYLLAVIAVMLATCSLAILGANHTTQLSSLTDLVSNIQPGSEAADASRSALVMMAIGVLTTLKMLVVVVIALNTRAANREKWNEMSVDYRYLAEKLRMMTYLPKAGCFDLPRESSPPFSSRVIRQSAIDWLFNTIVRAVSPADLPDAQPIKIQPPQAASAIEIKRILSLHPPSTIKVIRDQWIGEQAIYHERNALTMSRLQRWTNRLSLWFGGLVVAIVAVDLILVGLELVQQLSPSQSTAARLTWFVPHVKSTTPLLVILSAILPSVVAALSGIRYQSECQRLSERSAVMRALLIGSHADTDVRELAYWQVSDRLAARIEHAADHPEHNPGSWANEVLQVAEQIAAVFLKESSDWSVVYAKELNAPK
jgi:hypothetical protein